MALLYQRIMGVPGLTGTWQQRNRQLYELLGSPMGNYTGSLEQNMMIIGQLDKNNDFSAGLPGTQAPPQQQTQQPPATTIADDYAQPGVDAGLNTDQPSFQEALPWNVAWAQLEQPATDAANSVINPEIMRGYNSNYRDYMSGMTNTGGQRFGRALGGLGDLKASTERNRNSQLQDWLEAQKQGYKSLNYDIANTAWDNAIAQGKTPDQTLTDLPTWEDYYQNSNTAYNSGSPLYS